MILMEEFHMSVKREKTETIAASRINEIKPERGNTGSGRIRWWPKKKVILDIKEWV